MKKLFATTFLIFSAYCFAEAGDSNSFHTITIEMEKGNEYFDTQTVFYGGSFRIPIPWKNQDGENKVAFGFRTSTNGEVIILSSSPEMTKKTGVLNIYALAIDPWNSSEPTERIVIDKSQLDRTVHFKAFRHDGSVWGDSNITFAITDPFKEHKTGGGTEISGYPDAFAIKFNVKRSKNLIGHFLSALSQNGVTEIFDLSFVLDKLPQNIDTRENEFFHFKQNTAAFPAGNVQGITLNTIGTEPSMEQYAMLGEDLYLFVPSSSSEYKLNLLTTRDKNPQCKSTTPIDCIYSSETRISSSILLANKNAYYVPWYYRQEFPLKKSIGSQLFDDLENLVSIASPFELPEGKTNKVSIDRNRLINLSGSHLRQTAPAAKLLKRSNNNEKWENIELQTFDQYQEARLEEGFYKIQSSIQNAVFESKFSLDFIYNGSVSGEDAPVFVDDIFIGELDQNFIAAFKLTHNFSSPGDKLSIRIKPTKGSDWKILPYSINPYYSKVMSVNLNEYKNDSRLFDLEISVVNTRIVDQPTTKSITLSGLYLN